MLGHRPRCLESKETKRFKPPETDMARARPDHAGRYGFPARHAGRMPKCQNAEKKPTLTMLEEMELNYTIKLRTYITELDYTFILQDVIMELYYEIILWNYITERCYGIVLRNNLSK